MKYSIRHCLFYFLVAASFGGNAYAARDDRPNILFIIADDLTFRDIGCYGSENVETPHIDALASKGMRFTRCFQAAPMCSPTRHNIYTGLYPVKTGAYPNATWVREGTRSVAHYLKEAGYRVGITGKRHIGPKESFPFDDISDTTDPDIAALEAYLIKNDEQPFCAFVCFNEPHTPWTRGDPSIYDLDEVVIPPYLVDTLETRKRLVEYYAEINHLDDSIGKIAELLKTHDLENDTLLVFVSEQGNAFPFAKWTCYDSGIQSAMIVCWPGKIAAGSIANAMVEYVDILPTFLELAKAPFENELQGKSFLPVLRGETDRHKDYVFAVQTTRGITNGSPYYGIRSIRSERYKFIYNLTPEATFRNNVTQEKETWSSFWKTWVDLAETDDHARERVYRFQHRPAYELYDVIDDPYEMTNLVVEASYQSIVEELKKRLEHWMKEQGDLGQVTELDALNHSSKTGRQTGSFRDKSL